MSNENNTGNENEVAYKEIDGTYTEKGESQREFYATTLRPKMKELVELAATAGIALYGVMRFHDECKVAGCAPGEDSPTEDPWVLAHIIASGNSIAVPIPMPSEDDINGIADAAQWVLNLIHENPELKTIPPSVMARISMLEEPERGERLQEATDMIPHYAIVREYQDKPVDERCVEAMRAIGWSEDNLPQLGISLDDQECKCANCRAEREAAG